MCSPPPTPLSSPHLHVQCTKSAFCTFGVKSIWYEYKLIYTGFLPNLDSRSAAYTGTGVDVQARFPFTWLLVPSSLCTRPFDLVWRLRSDVSQCAQYTGPHDRRNLNGEVWPSATVAGPVQTLAFLFHTFWLEMVHSGCGFCGLSVGCSVPESESS